MKKIVIIGGGIAGLTAGIYAQKCGFDALILESHQIAGGNCTSWKRKGYLFEGGMHWLIGSGSQSPVNKLWHAIGALNDNVTIYYDEPYLEYNDHGTPIRLYRDVNMTEKHLCAISPADTKEIKAFCDRIRQIQIRLAQSEQGVEVDDSILSKQSINQFSHEGIREMFHAFEETEKGISLILTMGSLANGNGGFPEGGSLPFVRRIVKNFKSLGGKIRYHTRVERVVIENGKVTGVMIDGELLLADAVIVTVDTMAVDQLFDSQIQTPWMNEMRAETTPTMCTMVSLGINSDLKHYPKRLLLKLNNPIYLGEQQYQYLGITNYAGNTTYAPRGKTALTIYLGGDTYAFWKKAKEENRYTDEKQKIANQLIKVITTQMPESDEKIEVCDVATPLTFERYSGSWKGSWMTAVTPNMRVEPYPTIIRGLDGIYFAGHRMYPPGGLPLAMVSGITAVKRLCRDTNTTFIE